MRERLGRVMALFIMLMMLAGPMVRAQEAPATPEGESAPVSETVDPGSDNDGTGQPAGDEGTPDEPETPDPGQNDGSVTEPADPTGEEPGTPDPSGGEGDAGAGQNVGTEGEGNEETASETPDPAETPEDETATGSPETQVQNRGVTIQATRTLVVTVVTSDGAPVPAGTEVCVWNNTGEYCLTWEGTDLRFTPSSSQTNYEVHAPFDSDYASYLEGSISVPAGQSVSVTLTLQKKATLTIALEAAGGVPAGTEVCVWNTDDPCRIYPEDDLTFAVSPGDVDYDITPPGESGLALATGSFRVGAGESVTKTVTLQAPATVNVTVVSADGKPLPSWVQVCLRPSLEPCQNFVGEPNSFKVTPGDVEYGIYPEWNSAYREAFGTVTVGPNEIVDLTITLEPKAPAKLNVYVTTVDRQPVPAGTQVCVDMPEPEFGPAVNNECQTLSGSYVSFLTGQGEASITVTPPTGSGYAVETDSFWPRLDETTRAVFELERNGEAPTGHLSLTVSTQDGTPLAREDFQVCVYMDDLLEGLGCGDIGDEYTQNRDGSITLEGDGPSGTYNYVVIPIIPGYGAFTSSFTVVVGETTSVSAVLPVITEQDMATLVINLVTVDGSPVPYGAQVCAAVVTDIEGGPGGPEDFCRLWAGQPESFQLPANLAVYFAIPSEDGDSFGSQPGIIVLSPGETREVTITIYPEDLESGITHTVSNANPTSGETVTYTIHAWGQEGFRPTFAYEPWLGFEISNPLPVELSDISVSCAGVYESLVPGSCYELDGGILTILGGYTDSPFAGPSFFDITVTVTGTITGEPGTVVESTACFAPESRGEFARVGANKIASTNLYGLAMAQEFPDMPCATASLTIAQDIEPSPSPSPSPTETATPQPTGTATPQPTDPATPQPTETETPQPTDPATPGATATPQGEKAVTGLPKTGNGAGTGSSLAIYAGLAAAILLGGAGLLVRSRQPER